MLKIKKRVAQNIFDAIISINPEAANNINASEIESMLEYPPDANMGDLAFPCFKLSKILRRSPVQISSEIAPRLSDDAIGKAESVNGYLNICISEKYLCDNVIAEILEKGDKYGAPDIGKGKTVVLDYSSPNVAKPFHIGHLGTTVIGHSIKKLHEFAGYKCIGINYLGDWGTQFGKMIVAYKKWGNREEIENGGIDKLVELYVRINNEIKAEEDAGIEGNGKGKGENASKHSELADMSRAEFHKLELGDEENTALWKWFVDISLAEYQKTYKQLGITFDSYAGESFYTDKMPAQVEKLRECGLLKLDDGASIVDLSEYGMPPCLILKRDGSTLYPTRDIAAAVYRKNTYDFDKCIYVTSAGQSLHFAQWFKVVELMGYDWYDRLVHVPYGTVSINGAKLATRTGNVVLLKDLFAMAIEKVKTIMNEKNPNIPNKDETAEIVGVGAIVFYYLSNNRMKDINFMLEDALSFDGNTGPYVQYTYARTCSVLEKAANVPDCAKMKFTAPEEATLAKTLCRFEEKVRNALDDYEPSVITRYILDIATDFNRFYHECSILSADDPEVVATRVKLTEATKTVMGKAFELICMRTAEKI